MGQGVTEFGLQDRHLRVNLKMDRIHSHVLTFRVHFPEEFVRALSEKKRFSRIR